MVLRKTGVWIAVVACTLLVLSGMPSPADDKGKTSLSGTWQRTEGETRIEFADKDVLKISPHGKDEVILLVCKYSAEKDGMVKAKVTSLEGSAREKAQGIIPIGLEFSFKWESKDDNATLDEVKSKDSDSLKAHLEGKYEKK